MQTCQELIWLDPPRTNTYCQREKGHPNENGKGGHNIVNEPPREEKKPEESK